MVLRPLVAADLPSLLALSNTAGWNQTAEDWERLLRLQPDGCFGIEIDRTLAASATVMNYGTRLAWIGMVLTLPDFRGRGLARKLMEHSLAFAGERAVRLDASDMGKPLYEHLGFRDECAVERWVRPPSSPPLETAGEAAGLPSARVDLRLDEEAFGASRAALLEDLARYETAGDANGSYAFSRPGRLFHYFGPCVALEHADFRRLLQWCVARHGAAGPIAIDLFPHRRDAADTAREYGFEPVRRLSRMVLQPGAPELPDRRIYAAAGFEFG